MNTPFIVYTNILVPKIRPEDFNVCTINTFCAEIKMTEIDLYLNSNFYKTIQVSEYQNNYVEYVVESMIKPIACSEDNFLEDNVVVRTADFKLTGYDYDGTVTMHCDNQEFQIGKKGICFSGKKIKKDILEYCGNDIKDRWELLDFREE